MKRSPPSLEFVAALAVARQVSAAAAAANVAATRARVATLPTQIRALVVTVIRACDSVAAAVNLQSAELALYMVCTVPALGPVTQTALSRAFSRDDAPALALALLERYDGPLEDLCYVGAGNTNVQLAQAVFARFNGPITSMMFNRAARTGNVTLAHMLFTRMEHEHDTGVGADAFTDVMCRSAVRSGSVPLWHGVYARYVASHPGIDADSKRMMCHMAAHTGLAPMFDAVHARTGRPPVNHMMCYWAAVSGNAQLFDALLARYGGPVTDALCHAARESGNAALEARVREMFAAQQAAP